MSLGDFVKPARFRRLEKLLPPSRALILDIGCGNSSPSVTKRWLPHCTYHGADIQHYRLTEGDIRLLDRFFEVTQDLKGYEHIPADYYDAVILSHVIEHSRVPMELLSVAVTKLKPGGVIYIAFPSKKSLRLPSAEGTLHFCDDETHVWFPDIVQIVNQLLGMNVRILYAGPSTDMVRYLIGVLVLPFAMIKKLITGSLEAKGLCYVLGFEAIVLGRRKE